MNKCAKIYLESTTDAVRDMVSHIDSVWNSIDDVIFEIEGIEEKMEYLEDCYAEELVDHLKTVIAKAKSEGAEYVHLF